MKEVIRIDQPKQETEKPVEFTQIINSCGEADTSDLPSDFEKIVYLGKCRLDGDLFAAYSSDGTIEFYKGRLNSGKY